MFSIVVTGCVMLRQYKFCRGVFNLYKTYFWHSLHKYKLIDNKVHINNHTLKKNVNLTKLKTTWCNLRAYMLTISDWHALGYTKRTRLVPDARQLSLWLFWKLIVLKNWNNVEQVSNRDFDSDKAAGQMETVQCKDGPLITCATEF